MTTANGHSEASSKSVASQKKAELVVIGAGFCRTGTTSLSTALEKLGYKTFHMVDNMNNRSLPAKWLEAKANKDAGKPTDWDSLFGPGDYKACVDWPGAYFYKEMMEAYPNAIVILTERDFESWYESASETIFQMHEVYRRFKPPFYLAPIFSTLSTWLKMMEVIMWQGTFATKLKDKEHVRKIYEAHVAEVKRVVPAKRLVAFYPKEGWAPLCKALKKPVPKEPYPHINDTAEFKEELSGLFQVVNALRIGFAACNMVLGALLAATAYKLAARCWPQGTPTLLTERPTSWLGAWRSLLPKAQGASAASSTVVVAAPAVASAVAAPASTVLAGDK